MSLKGRSRPDRESSNETASRQHVKDAWPANGPELRVQRARSMASELFFGEDVG